MKSIQEQLIEKGLVQPVKREVEQKDTRTSKKRNERLSEWELAELMGTNRDIFKRHRGSVRRR
ncbi:hypothetical protein CSV80_00775 [Sporosarcina sp. P12(2017)]|uniref:hypothetical protein n=1 Tax=unclassified Sporosarcina TaxID=2647733 RepID=UPI000C169736|nr:MULTISPECIES: hypothetical protein [unclassified Sporosarcina]PIC59089.1 hypothetical protein CSV81_00775 [Sporosarcina sp. P10]PIC62410.1 hypothetical protein CSV80_00775 [Sporosarcina sp. P12(2017)]